MLYSLYYQAHIKRKECRFLTAVLRSFENVAFSRTINKQDSIFEFFVPEGTEKEFLAIMSFLEKDGVLKNLEKKPNRLSFPGEEL